VTRRLVLIAATADPIPHTREFARTLGFGERIHGRLLQRLEALCDGPLTEFDIPARARAPRGDAAALPDLLVVHDRLDKEVPYEEALAVSTAWPDAELATTQGLGHRRILRASSVVDLTVGFLGAPPAAPGEAGAAPLVQLRSATT
jgi:TAP-like protein